MKLSTGSDAYVISVVVPLERCRKPPYYRLLTQKRRSTPEIYTPVSTMSSSNLQKNVPREKIKGKKKVKKIKKNILPDACVINMQRLV